MCHKAASWVTHVCHAIVIDIAEDGALSQAMPLDSQSSRTFPTSPVRTRLLETVSEGGWDFPIHKRTSLH